MNTSFIVGGVPEHFNAPWIQAIDQRLFAKKSLDITWQDFSGGTGEMIKALDDKSLDIAVLLTEGIIRAIASGSKSKILSTYVASPLTWGIHVHAQSPIKTVKELKGKVFAISRPSSGSHLMAMVHHRSMGWDLEKDIQFEIVKNFSGAQEALRKRSADVLLWEKFTTKPTVDSGEWKRIGECPTPWPCFMIVARDDVLAEKNEQVKEVLHIIHNKCGEFMANREQSIQYICENYSLQYMDAQAWFDQTKWVQKITINKKVLEKTVSVLTQNNIVTQPISISSLCHFFPI